MLLGTLAKEASRASSPDVLVVAEGEVTAAGDPKPMHFAEAARRGEFDDLLSGVSDVLYVRQGEFPEGAVEDGWAADHYIRYLHVRDGQPELVLVDYLFSLPPGRM